MLGKERVAKLNKDLQALTSLVRPATKLFFNMRVEHCFLEQLQTFGFIISFSSFCLFGHFAGISL